MKKMVALFKSLRPIEKVTCVLFYLFTFGVCLLALFGLICLLII